MARSLAAQPYLSLDDYRKLFGIPLCSFNGVERPAETKGKCDHYWSQMERDMLAQALSDAEGMLASELRFYLGPRYLIDYDVPWRSPTLLRYGWVIGAGIRARDEVTPSASDFTVDPATITVPTASFSGGTTEVVVIEDSSGLEIEPDSITTVGLNYVINISQCK